MTKIDNYMNDGANWQAQAVLAYIRGGAESATDQTWNETTKSHDVEIEVGRYENGREQGYTFSVRIYASKAGDVRQGNWTVYEHRNADIICVVFSDVATVNTPTIEEAFGGKDQRGGYDKYFTYGKIGECGDYVLAQIGKFIYENYRPCK